MAAADSDRLAALQTENLRLVALLEANGIAWKGPDRPDTNPVGSSRLSAAEKVALFGSLFRGRSDVFPIRWESKTSGRSGYSPACANEWRQGICEKPRVKCSECGYRELIPLTDAALFNHLSGDHSIGVYPLLTDDTCHFVAADFDGGDWQEDARAFIQSCRALQVPAALEVSRSGNGAHAWIFFSGAVSARDARRLATAIISHTCSRKRQLSLSSYDRLFPNQDTMPKGGFGNLIALPLQKAPRERGFSIFVDEEFRPFPDQWAYLAALTRMSPREIEPTILQVTGGSHPLDVAFIEEEDLAEPWKLSNAEEAARRRLPGPMPASITITLSNRVYIEKAHLPQVLANRLIRLAAFQNPEFYRAQAMRMSVWDKPRVIGCADNFPRHIGLPRGCLDPVLDLLLRNAIHTELQDERFTGQIVQVGFTGELRDDQHGAVEAMLAQDTGVLCAPTGFGKTAVAAKVIAQRGVSTLILVHRTELLRQWQERLTAFLCIGAEFLGVIGGGKSRPTGRIDIAVMQALSRGGKVDARIENYGQIIVDECHHVGASSFEAILRSAKAKFVLGLTATPVRRDGQQPIIFMQCGPTRHTAGRAASVPKNLEVVPYLWNARIDVPAEAGIQEVFRRLAEDDRRTAAIAAGIQLAFAEGRKILVLTERTDHLKGLVAALDGRVPSLVLHGRMSKGQRSAAMNALNALPDSQPRVLLSTGKLVGEGFDHPPLDTLVLAMPISWKGTLQQYAGRLHRKCASKDDVRILDFVDTEHSALRRMWERRQIGYRAMGYRIRPANRDAGTGQLDWAS